MAISTYAELKTAFLNWTGRSGDTALTNRAPECITMVEGWIAYGLDMGQVKVPPLRIRAMETALSLSMVAGTAEIALPTRYVAMRNIYIDTDPKRKLTPVSPEQRIFEKPYAATGIPEVFSIEGDNIVLGDTPNAAGTIKGIYYQRFASFSADADTNWLLTNSPNTYLFGGLYASTLMTDNNKKGPQWLAAFMGSINALNEADKSDRYSGGVLTIRTATGTP